MKSNNWTITGIFVSLAIMLFSVMISDIWFITLLSIFQLVLGVAIHKKKMRSNNIPFLCFYIGIFIFCFGQLFVYYFLQDNNRDDIEYIVINRLSSNVLLDSAKYALLVYSSFFIGYILYSARSVTTDSIDAKHTNLNDGEFVFCYKLGVVLFFITIVPSFFYEYNIIRSGYLNGYIAGREAAATTGIVDDLAQLCRTSILLMIVGSKNKKKACVIMWIYVAFLALKMLFYGERGYATINIIICIWVYRNYVIQEKKAIGAKTILEASVLLVAFAIIGEMRTSSITTWTTDDIKNIISNNVFTRELVEFGGSLLTVGYIMEFVPSSVPFSCGGTFIAGLLHMLPNGSFTSKYQFFLSPTSVIYQARSRQSSLGECFVADFYLNFGFWGVLVSAIFGYFIAMLINRIIRETKEKSNPIIFVCCIRLLIILIWLVRGSFINVPREFEFAVLPVIILYLCFRSRAHRSNATIDVHTNS